ncbi:MAG TPA: hypothetical protein VGA34_00155 [Alteraurantiacibacter sp.]
MVIKLVACVAGIALMGTPLAAQDPVSDAPSADAVMDEVLAKVAEAFAVVPLTPEQEARLPAATQVVGKMIPEGTYARMMEQVMGDMLNPLFDSLFAGGMAPRDLSEATGLAIYELIEMDDAERAEITGILDPDHDRRTQLRIEGITKTMADMYGQMEPFLRDGLTRAYAARFSDQQLADVNAFFATPSGAFYASEHLLVYSDPQTMSAVMQAMPIMFDAMPVMLAGIEEADEQLPPIRDYDSLDPSERARLAELLGISGEELEAGMGWAAENSDEDSGTGWEE